MFNKVKNAVLAVALVCCTAVPSFAVVTLPDTGVDIPGTITAAGTEMGTYIAAAIGLMAAIITVKFAVNWIKASLRG